MPGRESEMVSIRAFNWSKDFGVTISAGSLETRFVKISGVGLSGYWLVRTTNTVRQLVLRKGGKHLTVVTYGLLGRSSKFTTIPLNHVSIHT